MGTLLRWVRRLVLMAAVAAVVERIVRRVARSNAPGAGAALPPIVGDTWPPVPTNPDRGD